MPFQVLVTDEFGLLLDSEAPAREPADTASTIEDEAEPLPLELLQIQERVTTALSDLADSQKPLNLTSMLFEFTDLEGLALRKFGRAQAANDLSPARQRILNSTRDAVQGIGEVVTITRYLLQMDDSVRLKEYTLYKRRDRLVKLQRTLDLLRRDNEARAREYVQYLEAAATASDKAVVAFATAKLQLLNEQRAWEAKQAAASSAQTTQTAGRLAAEGNAVAARRDDLQQLYRVAGAAKRIVEQPGAAFVNPAVGPRDWRELELEGAAKRAAEQAARRGWTARRAKDLQLVSGWDAEVQSLRETIATARSRIGQKHAAYQEELGRLQRQGAFDGASAETTATGKAVDSMLGGLLRRQVTGLMDVTRRLLETTRLQQLDKRAPGGGGDGEDSMAAWASSPERLAARAASLEEQRRRLEAARRILEDELARRADRAARRAVKPASAAAGAAGGAGAAADNTPPLPPSAQALLEAVRAAGGVGRGPAPTGLQHSTAIQRLLASIGVLQANGVAAGQTASAVNLGTGGAAGLGGCEFCNAQRQIGRLQDEIVRLQRDLARCVAAVGGAAARANATDAEAAASASPSPAAAGGADASFKPDCQPRLTFQITKLAEEVAKRRAALVAEEVEMERVLRHLQSSLAACDAPGSLAAASGGAITAGGVGDGTDAAAAAAAASALVSAPGSVNGTLPSHCAVPQRIAVRAYRKALQAELDSRLRIMTSGALRKQFSCLWTHRRAPATEVVARVLVDGGAAGNAEGGGAGGGGILLEVGSAEGEDLPAAGDAAAWSDLAASETPSHYVEAVEENRDRYYVEGDYGDAEEGAAGGEGEGEGTGDDGGHDSTEPAGEGEEEHGHQEDSGEAAPGEHEEEEVYDLAAVQAHLDELERQMEADAGADDGGDAGFAFFEDDSDGDGYGLAAAGEPDSSSLLEVSAATAGRHSSAARARSAHARSGRHTSGRALSPADASASELAEDDQLYPEWGTHGADASAGSAAAAAGAGAQAGLSGARFQSASGAAGVDAGADAEAGAEGQHSAEWWWRRRHHNARPAAAARAFATAATRAHAQLQQRVAAVFQRGAARRSARSKQFAAAIANAAMPSPTRTPAPTPSANSGAPGATGATSSDAQAAAATAAATVAAVPSPSAFPTPSPSFVPPPNMVKRANATTQMPGTFALPFTAARSSLASGPLQKMAVVCSALGRPSFAMAAGLRSCLCLELDQIVAMRADALAAADERAAAAAEERAAAVAAALAEAAKRKAAEEATVAAAKESLFETLKRRPDFAKLMEAALASAASAAAGAAASPTPAAAK